MKAQRPKTASKKGFRSSFDYFGSYTGNAVDNVTSAYFGSYTGNVIDSDETKPVQDADDL